MPNSCQFRPTTDTHPSDASFVHVGLLYLVMLQGLRQSEFPATLSALFPRHSFAEGSNLPLPLWERPA
jgi:hypothetical protein